MSTIQFSGIYFTFIAKIRQVIDVLKTVYRISVMYFVSIILMRIAGKRAVAQLDVSELVTSFMVSEIACMPITDPDVPIMNAIVFSATVIILEIILTKACIRAVPFKHMVTGKPDFLIINGNLREDALRSADVSLSELVSAMRKGGVESLDKIAYAVQEPDGTISVFPYRTDDGIQHMLICDGRLNKSEMRTFGFSDKDVSDMLKTHGIKSVSQVFYLGVDDGKNTFLIKKQTKTKDTV